MIGKITNYFVERRFGFLRPEGERSDVFFHRAEGRPEDVPHLAPGAEVECEVIAGPDGKRRAIQVSLDRRHMTGG